jgi:hypothetical protein
MNSSRHVENIFRIRWSWNGRKKWLSKRVEFPVKLGKLGTR